MADETKKLEMHFIQRNVPRQNDPAVEQRKRDRENGRQAAQVYAPEALLEAVNMMRNSKDEKQRLSAAKYIMDRAWGPPKAPDEQEVALGNRDIFDVLASISAEITQAIEEKPVNAEIKTESVTYEPGVIEVEAGDGESLGGAGFFAALTAAGGAVPAGEPEAGDPDEDEQ